MNSEEYDDDGNLVRFVESPANPMANARHFVADEHTGKAAEPLLVCSGGDAWFRWDGRCWPELTAPAMSSAIYHFFEHAQYPGTAGPLPFHPSKTKVATVTDALRAVTALDPKHTAPCWLRARAGDPPASEVVACENGLLHWPTRTLHDHTPRLFVHHAVPFPYDDRAPQPARWLRFLADLWPDDPEAVETLQEVFGYLLSGRLSLQKAFLLVGPKRSGKGTIARVLTALLGRDHVAGPTLASLVANFGLAPLIGRSVAIVSDARLTSRTDGGVLAERLLAITGEDTLTIDRKHREAVTLSLPTRFLMLSNELPRLSDASGALASRFVVLLTTESFYGKEDPGLTDALLAELPGILIWALDGLDRLTKRGHFLTPKSSSDAVREMEDLGSPVAAFLRDRCAIEAGAEVTVSDLWSSWRAWCEDQERKPGVKATFGRDLRAAVGGGLKVTQPREDGERKGRVYVGLRLATPADLSVSTRVTTPPPTLARADTGVGTLQDDEDPWAGPSTNAPDEWAPQNWGPCHGPSCTRTTRRYGPGGSPLCEACTSRDASWIVEAALR